MSSEEADVWVVRPQDVMDDEMRSFEVTLDSTEVERAGKFRFERDRRAYVVAHGLRRTVLGDLLGVGASRLVFSRQDSGQPHLKWPEKSQLYFSHSHTRELVAFAVAKSPVGVDVECVAGGQPDLDLLEPYVALPCVSQRIAELGADPADHFFFYWTALEAFWKAAGKGLSLENPRICFEKNSEGRFEVKAESGPGRRSGPPLASVARVLAPTGCIVSVALPRVPGASRNPCASLQSGRLEASKKGEYFQQTRRYKDSGFITIV